MAVHGGFENQWNRIRGALRDKVGDGQFTSWLNSMKLLDGNEDRIALGVPSSFIQHKVETAYGNLILSLWQDENPGIETIDILIDTGHGPHPASKARSGSHGRHNGATIGASASSSPQSMSNPQSTSNPQSMSNQVGAPDGLEERAEMCKPANPGASLSSGIVLESEPFGDAKPQDLPEELEESEDEAGLEDRGRKLGFRLISRYTFDRFVVGPSNEFAHAASRRVAERHTPTMNPLFIHGPPGLGKSHLLQAIGWHIQKTQPDRRVLFLNAEQFMYEFVRALRHEDIFTFKERFRSVDVLLMDDIQFIANKNHTQDEFFHTFNALVDQNRSIIVSADTDPANLVGLGERLKSRLKCGLVADILPTTYELRLSILQEKSVELTDRHRPSTQVLEFMAHKLPTNVRELEGALNRVVAHAELVNRSISIESVSELLHDAISQFERHLTIDEIQRVVAEHFTIRVADMHSHRRMRSIARPRQIAMALCKEMTQRSLPEIGRKFGGRDHTTVIHAVKKVDQLSSEDGSFREEVELLRRKLGG